MHGTLYKRFEADERIVTVDHVSEIPRFGTVPDMHGILCPFAPLDPQEVQEVTGYLQRRRLDVILGERDSAYYEKIHGEALPAALPRAFTALTDIYRAAAGRPGRERARLRANSTVPDAPHNHDDISQTCTVTGIGTIWYDSVHNQEFSAPLNHVFLFDGNIWHMASQKFPADHPKLTFFND